MPTIDWLWKVVIPVILATIIILSALGERDGLYGHDYVIKNGKQLPLVCFLIWIVGIAVVAGVLTMLPGKEED